MVCCAASSPIQGSRREPSTLQSLRNSLFSHAAENNAICSAKSLRHHGWETHGDVTKRSQRKATFSLAEVVNRTSLNFTFVANSETRSNP